MKQRNEKIYTDPDFILSEKYENSLSKALETKPDGLSNSAISKALSINPKELKKELTKLLTKMKEILNE